MDQTVIFTLILYSPFPKLTRSVELRLLPSRDRYCIETKKNHHSNIQHFFSSVHQLKVNKAKQFKAKSWILRILTSLVSLYTAVLSGMIKESNNKTRHPMTQERNQMENDFIFIGYVICILYVSLHALWSYKINITKPTSLV